MRAAIYARVSTKDKGQDVQNQLVQLRRYAEAKGWKWVEVIDHETGKHSDRTGFQRLFEMASRREIDIVLVWALDRFTREGVSATFIHLKRLHEHGVVFHSFQEEHFRTAGPIGELLIAIMAWVAEQERKRISERTKAGLAIARAKGRIGGRRPKVFDRAAAISMREEKPPKSWRVMERLLGVPQSTLRKVLKGVQQTSSAAGRKRVAKKSPSKVR